MTSQAMLSIAIVLCSLSGWYVVLHKYFAIKAKTKAQESAKAKSKSKSKHVIIKDPYIRHWACIMHLSGFSLMFGIIGLNIITPTIIWLLKKDQSEYFDNQGRRIIDFQIALSMLQLLSIIIGLLIFWTLPGAAKQLLSWTKSMRVLFSSGYHIPFNIFSIVPVFWGAIIMILGSIAAYKGLDFRYPVLPLLSAKKIKQEKTESFKRLNFG